MGRLADPHRGDRLRRGLFPRRTCSRTRARTLVGKTAVISGSGNVATHAAEKIVQLGGKVLTLSDSGGFIHDPDGIDAGEDRLGQGATRPHRRGRIEEYVDEFTSATFTRRQDARGACRATWRCPARRRTSCCGEDAKTLVANGCMAVSEGANMPTDLDGVHVFKDAKILYAPGKASNAGGVAVSGLEMSQNSERRAWKEDGARPDAQGHHDGHPQHLHRPMAIEGGGYIDYVKGANIAGFKKVADAMLAFGVV